MVQLKSLKEDNEMKVVKWKENFEEIKIIHESEKNILNSQISELKNKIEDNESKFSDNYNTTPNVKKKHVKSRNNKVINLQDITLKKI